jgi:hypothetical protein
MIVIDMSNHQVGQNCATLNTPRFKGQWLERKV